MENRAVLIRWGFWGAVVYAGCVAGGGCASGATIPAACEQGDTPECQMVLNGGRDSGGLLDVGVIVLPTDSGKCTTGTNCGGACVNTASDNANCGQCGNICSSPAICIESSCTIPQPGQDSGTTGMDASSGDTGGGGVDSSMCSGTESLCSGICVDTMNDPNNCGGCDVPCASGSCVSGLCTTSGMDSGTGGDSGGGGCAHSPCQTGGPLVDGCDDDLDGNVSAICEGDQPQCCTVAWSESCVEETESYCELFGCFDPGC